MKETIPQMRARHRHEIEEAIINQAVKGRTQTEAARILGMTTTGLNNIVRRQGIYWPVIRQGRRK